VSGRSRVRLRLVQRGHHAIRSLLPHGLIEEYLLMIHPIVLGCGQRLFDHDDRIAKLRLLSSTPTTTGVIVATYQPNY
jgi:dihydrofolate reductase